MSKNIQLIAWVVFIAVVGGALFYALTGNSNSQSATTAPASESQETINVEILKYSDYSCPACKQYIPFEERLKEDFGDNITIEYRHYPLSGFRYSELAARVVEAAGEQGKKKEMHDKVFDGQELWTQGNAEEIFETYALELDLDIDQFENDLNSDRIREAVARQKSEGQRRMVQSTPTFFINGQRVQQNPRDYAQFRSLVEMYMNR